MTKQEKQKYWKERLNTAETQFGQTVGAYALLIREYVAAFPGGAYTLSQEIGFDQSYISQQLRRKGLKGLREIATRIVDRLP